MSGDLVEKVDGNTDGTDLMRAVAAAIDKSNFQPLLGAIHEEIFWKSASRHKGVLRFGGDYMNRPGVLDVIANFSMDYTLHHFKPKEVLAAGDTVWGCFDVSMSFDHKGVPGSEKTVNLEMAFRWRLKDGKIIEHQGFFDTASLLIQQGLVGAPSS
jgi:ketosteroid isomerase-like protein